MNLTPTIMHEIIQFLYVACQTLTTLLFLSLEKGAFCTLPVRSHEIFNRRFIQSRF